MKKIGLFAFAMLLFAGISGCSEIRQISNKAKVPVRVTLSSFIFFRGYYVHLTNTSDSLLTGVSVKYLDVTGRHACEQEVGNMKPGQTVRLDPSDKHWVVSQNETIEIHSDIYLTRSYDTNSLINAM